MKIFELYSGIGGMHFALKESGIAGEVIRAIDINTTANAVYRINFPDFCLLERNIQGLKESDFNNLEIDMITMSPPCQPYTRNGLRRDMEDERNDSLLHVLTLIPKLTTVKFILLENVRGFEISEIRNRLLKTLDESGYNFQEFLLNPIQFSIPNSRLRYYLLAKKKPLQFCFEKKNEILNEIPKLREDVKNEVNKLNWKYKKLATKNNCFDIENVIDEKSEVLIPENILKKHALIFDVVTKDDSRSCCFTKAYSRYVEGTGSVFSPEKRERVKEIFEKLNEVAKDGDDYVKMLKELRLRYFSPKEIARIMCFPDSFAFPKDLSDKRKYRVLGNSINVHVVAILMRILIS